MPRRQKKYHYIYKTTNLINRKYYIGMHSTDDLNDEYTGSGTLLKRSINKYGKENFKCEILEILPNRNSLKEREKELINEDLLIDDLCMNLKIGGEGGLHKMTPEEAKIWHSMGGKKNWELNRDKLSLMVTEKNKRNWANGSFNCQYGNKYWIGRKHKEESKRKIGLSNSIKQKGESNSQYGTCWITNGIENKKIKKNNQLPNGWQYGRKIHP
jgi:group I intron endonuclease